jgi:DNA-binding LacI/PurR family transcriptional regulator
MPLTGRISCQRNCIPSELVVVGFDGIEEGERFYPALTTIPQYRAQKGRLAASRWLAAELMGDLELHCYLVIRQSC